MATIDDDQERENCEELLRKLGEEFVEGFGEVVDDDDDESGQAVNRP